ncbi:MAG: hypothetical protein N2Z84_01610, partial [Atribacterota bacterium]|nr:hypothetical protein [Atribacterota bacterium]
VLESVFISQAQIPKEAGEQTAGIEFRAYQGRVEKEILGSLSTHSEPKMEFYLKDHGAEGGS